MARRPPAGGRPERGGASPGPGPGKDPPSKRETPPLSSSRVSLAAEAARAGAGHRRGSQDLSNNGLAADILDAGSRIEDEPMGEAGISHSLHVVRQNVVAAPKHSSGLCGAEQGQGPPRGGTQEQGGGAAGGL